jgi:hypothetical protein
MFTLAIFSGGLVASCLALEFDLQRASAADCPLWVSNLHLSSLGYFSGRERVRFVEPMFI